MIPVSVVYVFSLYVCLLYIESVKVILVLSHLFLLLNA